MSIWRDVFGSFQDPRVAVFLGNGLVCSTGGYAGGIVFISEADIVLAATSNTGLQPCGSTLRNIVADCAATFL